MVCGGSFGDGAEFVQVLFGLAHTGKPKTENLDPPPLGHQNRHFLGGGGMCQELPKHGGRACRLGELAKKLRKQCTSNVQGLYKVVNRQAAHYIAHVRYLVGQPYDSTP